MLILNFWPATRFKQVGTGTTKDWGSCEMLIKQLTSLVSQVIVFGLKGASSKGSVIPKKGRVNIHHMLQKHILLHERG